MERLKSEVYNDIEISFFKNKGKVLATFHYEDRPKKFLGSTKEEVFEKIKERLRFNGKHTLTSIIGRKNLQVGAKKKVSPTYYITTKGGKTLKLNKAEYEKYILEVRRIRKDMEKRKLVGVDAVLYKPDKISKRMW